MKYKIETPIDEKQAKALAKFFKKKKINATFRTIAEESDIENVVNFLQKNSGVSYFRRDMLAALNLRKFGLPLHFAIMLRDYLKKHPESGVIEFHVDYDSNPRYVHNLACRQKVEDLFNKEVKELEEKIKKADEKKTLRGIAWTAEEDRKKLLEKDPKQYQCNLQLCKDCPYTQISSSKRPPLTHSLDALIEPPTK